MVDVCVCVCGSVRIYIYINIYQEPAYSLSGGREQTEIYTEINRYIVVDR